LNAFFSLIRSLELELTLHRFGFAQLQAMLVTQPMYLCQLLTLIAAFYQIKAGGIKYYNSIQNNTIIGNIGYFG
jgi:hypothetical protein